MTRWQSLRLHFTLHLKTILSNFKPSKRLRLDLYIALCSFDSRQRSVNTRVSGGHVRSGITPRCLAADVGSFPKNIHILILFTHLSYVLIYYMSLFIDLLTHDLLTNDPESNKIVAFWVIFIMRNYLFGKP